MPAINDWEKWLTPKKGEYLLRIRDAVRTIDEHDNKHVPLSYFIPHGIKHFKKVEDNFHKLIPDKQAEDLLEEEERFFLLASAWLHDIGMYRSIAKDVWGTDLEDNEIRDNHHITSAKFIVNNYVRCGLEETDKEFLATLCLYHRKKENIEKCPTQMTIGVDNKAFKLKLLAAYLRLADALDIGTYRASDPAYSICLAYNIPQESKMHWIKNRIINGIHIDSNGHKITVEFIEPKIDDHYNQENPDARKIINEKLDYVIDLVMQDLHEELKSISQILMINNITFFFEMDQKKNTGYVPERVLNDLIGMVANYDILVHPSASRLLEMILSTIANISGFHLSKRNTPRKFRNENNIIFSKIKDELYQFYTKISNELVRSRPCHLGLTKLLEKCKEITASRLDQDQNNFDDFMAEINQLYSNHHQYRDKVREHSASFFSDNFSHKIASKQEIVIILYGYSELAIKSLCGFRDSILMKLYPNHNPRDYYNHKIEEAMSKLIRIYICEGQPKTITANNDKLIYHDGTVYSEALRNRKFCNIIIVPDAAVANILQNENIDLILLGANGFTSKSFMHSAGHSCIVNLGLYHKISSQSQFPFIVLSTTKEKFLPDYHINYTKKKKYPDFENSVNGCIQFYESNKVETRRKIWFTKDSKVIKQLCDNRIKLFNPREDVIAISDLDFVISNDGWHPIKSGSIQPHNVTEMIEKFINAQQ